jgi:hypothetical protein
MRDRNTDDLDERLRRLDDHTRRVREDAEALAIKVCLAPAGAPSRSLGGAAKTAVEAAGEALALSFRAA